MVIKAYLKYETICYTGVVDKEYNNELIGAVEEYQKALNLTTQDGTLDTETLTTMGFTVDDGRIVDNSYYQTYLKVARVYNDERFSYDVTLDDGSVEKRYIIFGQTYSDTDSAYNELKNTQNSYYGTYYTFDENIANTPSESDLISTEEKIDVLIEDFADKYPRSALALQRFRDNTGATLNLGEIKSIFDIENQTSLRNIQLGRCMEASEEYLSDGLIDVKMAFEYCYTTNIGTGLSDTQLDWYGAANAVSMGLTSTTTKNGNHYTMISTFNMIDYYDWGNSVFFFPNIEVPLMFEKDLKDLHYMGRAKNFESIGNNYVVKTVWNEGQTIDEATITVLSY